MIMMSFDYNYNPNNRFITIKEGKHRVDIKYGENIRVGTSCGDIVITYKELLDYILDS